MNSIKVFIYLHIALFLILRIGLHARKMKSISLINKIGILPTDISN